MRFQPTIRLILLLGLLASSTLGVFAQSLPRVPGDILVQTHTREGIQAVLERAAFLGNAPTGVRLLGAISQNAPIFHLHAPAHLVDDRLLLERIRAFPEVAAAQFNHLLEERSVPNDNNFGNQWQWQNTGQSGGKIGADIDMVKAWAITKGGVTAGGDTIVIAVVDNGINLNHADFAGNLWVNHAEIPGNGIDDDNNGYIDDYLGWNTTQSNDNVGVNGSHGTPVSGMIGARGDNGLGVTGVNWYVKIMTIRPSSTQEALVITSYDYALTQRKRFNQTNGQEGAFVVAVNSSWGINYGQPSDAPLWCAFYDTMGVHGILNAAATANLNIDVDLNGDLPTACPSDYLLSVTSTNHNDLKASAAFGKNSIDLAAPGQNIYTTNNNGGYSSTSGTSFASPTVAGLIGLVYSSPCMDLGAMALQDPAETALFVRDAIFQGVNVLPNLEPILATGGRANAFNALKKVVQVCYTCPEPFNLSSAIQSDNTAQITWLDLGNTLSFDLRWRAIGSPDWTLIENVQQPYTLAGLDECTEYEVEVLANCAGEASPYAALAFSSFGCCQPPADLTLTELTETSALISWSNPNNATTVTLAWLEAGAQDYVVEPNISGESFLLEGLAPCTAYSLKLASICGQEESKDSPEIEFVTAGCVNCDSPANLTVTDLTDNSVSLSWNPSPEADGYIVAYLKMGDTDYVQYPAAPETEWTESDLAPCTVYTFEIIAQCAGAESAPTQVTVTTLGCVSCSEKEVCESQATDSSLEFIEAIQIAGFTNVSGDDGGYGDYTDLSFDLLTYYKYNYTLTPGFLGFEYVENWKVWIDFNQDGIFQDPEELIIGPLSSNEPVTGTFKVPGNAVPGSARMRVQMNFSANGQPCGTFSFGEVEDYCVNIVLATEPCDFPDNLAVGTITESTAEIEWTPLTTAINYVVEYRVQGATDWLEQTADNPPTLLTGLEPCTFYEVQVRTQCDTSFSLPGNIITFRTKGCGACLDFTYCPAGTTGSTSQWIDEMSVAGVTNNSGSDNGYAFFPDFPITLLTNHDYDMVIKPGANFGLNSNYYRVYIDYNQNGTFGPFEQVGFIDATNANQVIINFEVPSGALEGQTRMRLVMQSFSGDNNPCVSFFTGEVEDYCVQIIKAEPPCIARPIRLDSIVEGSVSLSWKEVKPATSYLLEYRIAGAPVWTELSLQVPFVTLSPLASCTDYEVRMRSICVSDTTDYGPVLAFKSFGCGACRDFTYCPSNGVNTSDEYIQRVQLNTLDNDSGDNNGYFFFDGITTRLDTGEVYTITVTPGFGFGAFNEYFRAWIDYNQNGLFEPGELILSAVDNEAVSNTFVVPGSPLGETRMRVMMSFSQPASACGSFTYGEVEDYCIQIGSAEIPCLIPSYFDTVSVGFTQASVAWDSAATSIGYILRFRELGAPSWAMEMPTLDNSFVFNGLTECTEYEVQLITICQNKLSDAGTLIFKTACTTSLNNDWSDVSAARVYPNPFDRSPILEYQLATAQEVDLQIWDARGALVARQQRWVDAGLQRQTLHELDLQPSGLYLIRMQSKEGQIRVLRVAKQ